jgi:hypothetical protein
MKYFKKILFGEYSLLISFWLIYVLGTTILTIISINFISILLSTLTIFFICISLIGVWNSADFYINEKRKIRKFPFWAYISRAWIIIVIIFIIKSLIFYSPKLLDKGLGNYNSICFSILKGATQDILNFPFQVLHFIVSR